MKVNSSAPVTIASVKDTLKAREKEGELGYEQKQAQEYCEKFAKQEKKEAVKLVEKIMENKRVTAEVAVAIVNTVPKYPETVKAIALRDKVELSDAEAEEILKLLK